MNTEELINFVSKAIHTNPSVADDLLSVVADGFFSEGKLENVTATEIRAFSETASIAKEHELSLESIRIQLIDSLTPF